MNIIFPQSSLVTAKTCGCNERKQKVTYAFSDGFHSLCMDKKDVLEAQIQACERLMKYTKNASEMPAIEKEITELKMALDLMT